MLLKTVKYFERKNQLDKKKLFEVYKKKDEDMLCKFRLRL